MMLAADVAVRDEKRRAVQDLTKAEFKTKEARNNNSTLSAAAMWRRHSCWVETQTS